LQKLDNVALFLAGLGIGVAGAILLAPAAGDQTRGKIRDMANRAGDAVKDGAKNLGDKAGQTLEEQGLTWNNLQDKGSKIMGDMKDKAKDKIDNAADAAKKGVDTVADKSKDAAHKAGKKMEETGKQTAGCLKPGAGWE